MRIKNLELRIKLFGFVCFILTALFLPLATHAAESSPSADVKSKLEELKKEIASKAAILKQEVNKKLQNKAYVGILKTKSDTSITLASQRGPKLVSLNQDTILPKKGIAEEDYIAALGDIDETGVLIARKIILLPTTNHQPKTYLWGQIISISQKLITLKDKSLKNIALSPPSGAVVKVGQFIVATGTRNSNDVFEAEFIHAKER